MSDTCNAARCTKRLLGDAIMKTMQEKIGAEAWEAMSVEERNSKFRFYRADCWQHLRNIIIEAMSQAGTACLKDTLSESLEQFSSFERIEVDAKAIIRAAFKQFHHGGEYAKGRGREFESWRKQEHCSARWIPFERAMGSRQDLAFDGSVPLFLNRAVCLEFLRGYIDCPKSQNVLDKSLYTLLRCNEFTALLRANTLWKMLFSEPFRWLSGKTGKIKDWSLWNMSGVLDLVEGAMEMIAADPSKLLDPEFDMFASVAAAVPEFKEWREQFMANTVLAEDGETEHAINREALRMARSPETGTGAEQSTEMTLTLLKEMATRAVEKLHDKKIALADKLTSQGGVNAIGKRQEAAARTRGIDGTNDRAESKFATADYIMRTYTAASACSTRPASCSSALPTTLIGRCVWSAIGESARRPRRTSSRRLSAPASSGSSAASYATRSSTWRGTSSSRRSPRHARSGSSTTTRSSRSVSRRCSASSTPSSKSTRRRSTCLTRG